MDDQYEGRPRRKLSTLIFNVLTVLFVLASLCVGSAFAALLIDPQLPYNPYPPPTQVATLGAPTATNTPAINLPTELPATETPTPGPSDTPRPTRTPTVTTTPTVDQTQEVIDMTTTPDGMPFEVQEGNPVFIPNIANDLQCDWMGIGGQVFDLNGSPIIGLSVHLEGTLQEEPLSLDTLTGSASNLGPSGYVFDLATEPIASEGEIWIQLTDTSGVALSDQLFLDTSDSCSENFVLVNWRQTR